MRTEQMTTNWRISTANGVLVAAYFVPVWLIAAWRTAVSPVHGLYERPHIALAIFISDHFHPAAGAVIRMAWLVTLAKVTVAAFFVVFVVLAFRRSVRMAGGCDEALAIALSIGSLMSFAGMVMASHTGELEALRLHATELMLLLGVAILSLIDRPAQKAAEGVSQPIVLNLPAASPHG
jgi:hypothetical protein